MLTQTFRRDRQTVVAETRRQVGRFLVIGGASVATDCAVYLLLTGFFGCATHVAKGLSYVAGMAVGFVGNKYWTFRSSRHSASEAVSYTLLYAVTLAANIGVNAAVLAALGPSSKPLAFLVATGVTTALNFLGMRLVTFRAGINQRLAHLRTEPPAPNLSDREPTRPAGQSRDRALAKG